MAIHNAIKNYKGKTTAYIDGLAYGMASIIALACDEIHMSENARFGMSEASIFMVSSEPDEMKWRVKELKKVNSVMAEIYMVRPKKTKKEMLKVMEQETWLTAKEAKKNGFVDFIFEDVKECVAK